MGDSEFVFGMVGLIFKPEAAFLLQGPLSPSVGQLKHPVKQYLTKNASRWHFNAKNGHFGTKSKYSNKSNSNILLVKG